MASLKEIKGRIASVRSTLKITSAMKLVASAKLRKAQDALGNMMPYQMHLTGILSELMHTSEVGSSAYTADRPLRKAVLVVFSSNSSLCGGFNGNVIRKAQEVLAEWRAEGLKDKDIKVYSVGRRGADAMRKAGFPSPADYTAMSHTPDYEAAAALAEELTSGFLSGRIDRVELVYNHFKSASTQQVMREVYLPMNLASATLSGEAEVDYILEPDRQTLVGMLLPKASRLKIYTVLLDSAAAEHAARTVAMQTATDNGNTLLQELTLEYNKGRQQKITSEILDLEGGSLQ